MVRPPTEQNICLRCKGARLLCGKPTCPILLKTSILKSILPYDSIKSRRDIELFGASPPGFFVGRFNYPKVSIGPLVPFNEFEKSLKLRLSDPHLLDAPELWYGRKMVDIIKYRSSLVRNNFRVNVYTGKNQLKNTPSLKEQRLLERSQLLSMAARPVDTETRLQKISLRMTLDNHALPIGPSGYTEKIKIDENVKIHPKVEYCVSDTDLKAQEAISEYLYMEGKVPLSTIQRVFSAGLLGEQKRRKLVPTRWTITAVDDILSKRLIEEIKKFPEINDYRIFEGEYLSNHFKILLFPGKFAFEMNEVWAPNSLWNISINGKAKEVKPQIMTDYEFYRGRKSYASNITGAYYAARKSICEYLYQIKRQARILVFREVSSGYTVPLGVWVIRETVKSAMLFSDPIKVDNFNQALEEMTKDLILDLKYWQNSSKLIEFIKTQKTIDDYI
ncbi:MAG: Nre family DNA repair protein [Candidatus Lokiarchaeota archaeon]